MQDRLPPCGRAVLLAFGVVAADPALGADRVLCRNLATLASPATPVAGTTLRIVASADAGAPDDVVIQDPSGRVVDGGRIAHDGIPWSVVTTVERPAAGTYRVALRRGEQLDVCESVLVPDASGPSEPARLEGHAWP